MLSSGDVSGPNFGANQGVIKAATNDITKGWIFNEARGISPEEAQSLCVRHPEWQSVRLSMKGVPTAKKLLILLDWVNGWRRTDNMLVEAAEISGNIRRKQVVNYLGALRRGGQLDDNNMIRKYI